MNNTEQSHAESFQAHRASRAGKKQTRAEQGFWETAGKWVNDPLFHFETHRADDYEGERLMASTYAKGCFRSLTLSRTGGYVKRESLRSFGMVDGSRVSFWEASQTLHFRES